MSIITVNEKKEFVRWFLKHYDLKNRECVWILNYLLSHELLLENIHFTDDAHFCPRAMVISTTESENIAFRFFKGSVVTKDAEKAFHDLRLQQDEKMYIQLNFLNSHTCHKYAIVCEENPFIPTYLQVSDGDREIAKQLVNESMSSMTEEKLMKDINEALDMTDKERFISLSALLNDYKAQKNL